MSYKNFAHEAEDDRLRNLIHASKYEIEAARTKWEYQTDLSLLPTQAASYFDTQFAYLRLITQQFSVVYYTGLAADAQVREALWSDRASDLEAGKPDSPLSIAQYYVQLRTDNVDVSQKFATWASQIAGVASDLRARAESLYSRGAMAQEEFNYYIELDRIGQAAIVAANAEVQKAQRSLAEAQSDLAQVSHAAHGVHVPEARPRE
jgi:hypothetical protein